MNAEAKTLAAKLRDYADQLDANYVDGDVDALREAADFLDRLSAPVERDALKAAQPSAFRVRHPNGSYHYFIVEEQARDFAELWGCSYDGLYLRSGAPSPKDQPQ